MSVLFRNILGDKLLNEKVSETERELPSPEKLKGKIILKARVDEVARDDEEEEDDMSRDLYIGKVSTDLTDMVVYCKAKPGGINMTKIKESLRYIRLQKSKNLDLKEMYGKPDNCLDYDDITSINNENLAKVLIEAKYDMKLIQEFHRTVLTRVYPPAANFQSGNYNPIPHWQSGAQLVSLNVQTPGLPLQINNAMFATNGNCGYVLKNPEKTNEDNSSCLVTLKVLAARHIMTLKEAKEPFLKPHVQVTLQDTETQGEIIVLSTEKRITSQTMPKPTGYHTIWDASDSEATVIHNKHMAFLKFTLTEVNNIS